MEGRFNNLVQENKAGRREARTSLNYLKRQMIAVENSLPEDLKSSEASIRSSTEQHLNEARWALGNEPTRNLNNRTEYEHKFINIFDEEYKSTFIRKANMIFKYGANDQWKDSEWNILMQEKNKFHQIRCRLLKNTEELDTIKDTLQRLNH